MNLISLSSLKLGAPQVLYILISRPPGKNLELTSAAAAFDPDHAFLAWIIDLFQMILVRSTYTDV
jgi:hypothetical protein